MINPDAEKKTIGQTNPRVKFKKECEGFEHLLEKSESLCDRLPSLIEGYWENNPFGILHYLFARNLRLIRTSYILASEGKYTEATCLIRASMEGALLLKYLISDFDEIGEWHTSDVDPESEPDRKKRKVLMWKKIKKYGPAAIRKKVAGSNKALEDDLSDLYEKLSGAVHPPALGIDEFNVKIEGVYKVTRAPIFYEHLFVDWFKAATLCLTDSLKLLGGLYMYNQFEHLGKQFLFELRELQSQILNLLSLRKQINVSNTLYVSNTL